MRVLLIGDYPPPYGGIAVQLQCLARVLPEAGIGCRILNIGPGRTRPSPDYESVRHPWDLVRKLVAYARAGYVLHLFTSGENWKSWGLALTVGTVGRVVGSRSVVTVTSGGIPAYLARSRRLIRVLARAAVKVPTAVICRTPAILAALEGWRQADLTVLPAFSARRMRPAELAPSALRAFAASHRPLLVSVAILRREYDIPTLLQSFRTLRREHPAAGLAVVGGGEDEDQVRDLVARWQLRDGVLLLGWLPHDECLAAIREADVFLRTTLYDGDASSVREALALGVPVVATATAFRPPGIRLTRPGDPDSLTDGIRQALLDTRARGPGDRNGHPDEDEPLLAVYRGL